LINSFNQSNYVVLAMNFLAHIYLSGDDQPLTIGNFMGDFVKGKGYRDFSPEIQKGIHLHRAIDSFTDSHEIVKESKERLREKYRHYSGVITDIFYDHYLANKWHEYHGKDLKAYTLAFYEMMDRERQVLPDRVNYIIYHMKRDNWLFAYRTLEGIGKALEGISKRTTFDSKMDEAISDLKSDYALYEDEFDRFFPILENHCQDFLQSYDLDK